MIVFSIDESSSLLTPSYSPIIMVLVCRLSSLEVEISKETLIVLVLRFFIHFRLYASAALLDSGTSH